LAGGVPSPGVVVEGITEATKKNKPSKPPEKDKNSEKTGGFAHVLAYKLPKTPFFAQKYLTRYTHETYCKEYMNSEVHYLKVVSSEN
jgi:hypothetical protein